MTTQFHYRNTCFALSSHGELSEKEEVEAVAILQGLTCKESAKARGVSPETVKCQRAMAKYKVGARSQVDFVMTVVSRGWLSTFLQGVLRRAAQFAKTRKDRQQAHTLNEGLVPILCHRPDGDLPFFELTHTQKNHVVRLKADNAVRYLAFLATLKRQGGAA